MMIVYWLDAKSSIRPGPSSPLKIAGCTKDAGSIDGGAIPPSI